jgi:hypothetical protein
MERRIISRAEANEIRANMASCDVMVGRILADIAPRVEELKPIEAERIRLLPDVYEVHPW